MFASCGRQTSAQASHFVKRDTSLFSFKVSDVTKLKKTVTWSL